MTRVKICGITSEADLEVAIDAGADAIGIICDVPVDTPREVSRERASALAAAVPPFVTSVLVTMPETPTDAIGLVEAVDPDAIQFHGEATPTELAALREAVDASLLYAIDAAEAATDAAADGATDAATDGATDAATDAADTTVLERYDDAVDALLVDTTSEDGGGGTGDTHDWERTRRVAAAIDSPLILAGGLTPENVGEAVRTVDPFAVDVASGVEAEGGVKDPDAVRTFVDRATTVSRTVRP